MGLMIKVSSEQITADVEGMIGVGLTVTVTVNGSPSQLPCAPEVGVTV